MVAIPNFARVLGAFALAATVFAPAAVAAQQARSAGIPAYHMVQLEVKASEIDPADFNAQTREIRDCGDAMDVAEAFDAEITRNRFVRATQLPQDVRDVIDATPIGQATPVFSADGETLRVLVVCNLA